MAGIVHKTSRLMAAVLLGCLLAGCGGQLLSHREIVRAVFFTSQDAGYTVTLLTSDQQSEDSAACKTFTGSGATCAAAWNAAAQTMNGQPFYGLMDLAVLPAGCSWPLAEEIAQLLQSTARPAPEIAVFVLDPAVQMPIQDQTPTLYENLKALEEKQQLHCGLQTLFDNAETAAVPVSAGGEYAMLFMIPLPIQPARRKARWLPSWRLFCAARPIGWTARCRMTCTLPPKPPPMCRYWPPAACG